MAPASDLGGESWGDLGAGSLLHVLDSQVSLYEAGWWWVFADGVGRGQVTSMCISPSRVLM